MGSLFRNPLECLCRQSRLEYKSALTLLLIIGLLGAGVAIAGTPKSAKVPRIGYLVLPALDDPPSEERQAFLQGLRELGYVEGKTIMIEYRSAAWNRELLPDIAAELVDLKVDLIVAAGLTIQAAKDATKTIPIVMPASPDPVGAGFVGSLARPGGNVTGLSLVAPDLSGKRLELLKEAVGKVSRLAVLWNSASPSAETEWKAMQPAAKALGIKLESRAVRNADEFLRAFSDMSRRRPDGLITILDTLTSSYSKIIADWALQARLPTMFGYGAAAEAGGLMSYAPRFPDLYRRAAYYVDRILKGSKPADLPVEQPTKFDFIINLKTAKQIGVAMSPEVLMRADKIIK
ncbi:MAG TPA: ABC transporter substrate-binding protein [Candidatus Binatia bacterium]|nr:ABC transporter substrate-binding protein [Candidatus Binatia bacterium]